jgi:predicted acyltransferase
VCPVVKRIWTPSFALWSGGFCFLFTAFFHELLDVRGRQRWAFPLVVLGMNSIAAYCLYEAFVGPIERALVRHLPGSVFLLLGPAFEQTLVGVGSLAAIWLILLWMHRRRIFVRI